jgi:hypothetical protein
MAYENEILIKLNREYSRDEMFAFSIRKIKEQAIEIGKLESYVLELEENPINKDYKLRNDLLYQENTRLRNDNKALANKGIDTKSQFKIKDLLESEKKLHRQISALKKQISEYKQEINNFKKDNKCVV